MTLRHAIVAFPVLDAATAIESTRRRFDPMAATLPAHVTLVFPFADVMNDAKLASHLARTIVGQPAFDITLSGITVDDGGYILLGVDQGADVLHGLHRSLYTGILASHLSPSHVYRPHVTIGRLPDRERATLAAGEARRALSAPSLGRIHELALFRLHESGRGEVALTVGLAPGATDRR